MVRFFPLNFFLFHLMTAACASAGSGFELAVNPADAPTYDLVKCRTGDSSYLAASTLLSGLSDREREIYSSFNFFSGMSVDGIYQACFVLFDTQPSSDSESGSLGNYFENFIGLIKIEKCGTGRDAFLAAQDLYLSLSPEEEKILKNADFYYAKKISKKSFQACSSILDNQTHD
jgi:hypothetical protein